MARPRLRALLLTAGFGTRLRPLTYSLPKALLPVGGRTVVGHTLIGLARFGCQGAVLNLHHLPDRIPTHFGRSYAQMALEYSPEPEILGTFGALHGPRSFLADCDAVLLINGDSLCQWPVRKVVAEHLKSGADATLLLLERAPEKSLGGGIGVTADGRVAQLRDLAAAPGLEPAKQRIFAGLHVLSPALLDRVEPRFGDILTDLYQPLLQAGGTIRTLTTRRAWHDLGTPSRYLNAALQVLDRGWRGVRSAVSPLASVDAGARVRHSSIERGVRVGKDAVIDGSVLLEGAAVGDGCRLVRSIVGPGVRVPSGSDVDNRMMTRADKRHELTEHESMIGDLIYTSLDVTH